MIDLVFLHVELGDPWHRTACTEMLRSAQRVFPGANIVQLCDQDTPLHPWADAEWRANLKVTKENYGEFRQFIFQDYLCRANSPVIASEIDGLWIPAGYEGNYPALVTERKFGPATYLSFRECPENMVSFARMMDGGKPFTEMLPRTVDISHIAKEVNVGDPEFGRIEFVSSS